MLHGIAVNQWSLFIVSAVIKCEDVSKILVVALTVKACLQNQRLSGKLEAAPPAIKGCRKHCRVLEVPVTCNNNKTMLVIYVKSQMQKL